MNRITKGQRVFAVFNYIILGVLALSCILPILHLLAVSLSSKTASDNNMVGLWPVEFNVDSYKYLIQGKTFFRAFGISVYRTILGTAINIVLIILLAYPLSKDKNEFTGRSVYIAMLLFIMIFSAGMVPYYLYINDLGLFDTVWALVLPTCVPIFSVILMMNFMRSLPKEMEEAAKVDGAGYWNCMISIVLPVCLPSIATVTLLSFVTHWNSWFDGLLYNNDIANYPLQTYLQVILTNKAPSSIDESMVNIGRNMKAAQIFVTMLPLLAVYPFLQKYFVTGMVIGSVKG